jgi:hypothetical protein
MPIFRVDDDVLRPLAPAVFAEAHSEDRLEAILAASGNEFDVCWIARQPHTDLNKRPDLIGIARDGTVEVWELKRGQAPRDIVAQALEYAAWASRLDREALEQIASRSDFEGERLEDLLETAFAGDEDSWSMPRLNTRQRVVLVAQGFDPQTLDVCRWLGEQGVSIACWQFSYHQGEADEELLSFERLTWGTKEERHATSRRRGHRTPPTDRAKMLAAMNILTGRVGDLVEAGKLNAEKTFWLYTGRCFVTEVELENAGPLGLDIFYESPAGHPPGVVVRFMTRGWRGVRRAPRAAVIAQYEDALCEAITEAVGLTRFILDGAGGLPAWFLPEPEELSDADWKPEVVADHVEKIVRAVARVVPFRAREK